MDKTESTPCDQNQIARGRLLAQHGPGANWPMRPLLSKEILKALRTGKHLGVSRDILPPMPWQNLAAATDEDLEASYAYLRSIPPVTNHVPDPIPPGGPLGLE